MLIFSRLFLSFSTQEIFDRSQILNEKLDETEQKEEKRRKKERKAIYQIIFLRYSLLKGFSVNTPFIRNKRSHLEAFCFDHIKSSNQKLEASAKRRFAEISVCQKARSILEGT